MSLLFYLVMLQFNAVEFFQIGKEFFFKQGGKDMSKNGGLILKFIGVIVILFAVAGITFALAHPKAQTGGWVKSELYFGRDVTSGYEITPQQWHDFLANVVTKQFPKGLTVYAAYGQILDANKKIVDQSTWVVEIVHENTEENENKMKIVIDEYRKQFQQPEVMRTETPISVQFYTNK